MQQMEEQYYLNSQGKHFGIPTINHKIKQIAKQNDIEVLDIYNLLCNSDIKKCKYLTADNKIIYRDYGHLTIYGMNLLAELIFKKNENLLNF